MTEVVSATDQPFKFVCTHNETLKTETAVTVVVRPERIIISSEPDNKTPNCLRGIIQDESYLGTTVQYSVQTDHPTPIIVNQQWQGVDTASTSNEQNAANSRSQRFKKGDTVYLHWLPENTIVIKAN